MSNLKDDYHTLYRRVVKKGIVNLGFGVALVFTPPLPAETARSTILEPYLHVGGLIFIVLGLLILIGVFKAKQSYRFARLAITASAVYSAVWLVALFASVMDGNTRSMAVLILWAYWLENQFEIITDPGWGAIEFIKRSVSEAREDGRVIK